MKRFEYFKTNDSTQAELNDLGKVGWELVSAVCRTSGAILYVFKRELTV